MIVGKLAHKHLSPPPRPGPIMPPRRRPVHNPLAGVLMLRHRLYSANTLPSLLKPGSFDREAGGQARGII